MIPTTVQILIGTVGVAILALVAFGYLVRIGRRALGGNDAEETHLPAVSASGRVATNRVGDYNSALLALQQEQRRRELIRRVDAAAGVRGPARLEDRRFPSA